MNNFYVNICVRFLMINEWFRINGKEYQPEFTLQKNHS